MRGSYLFGDEAIVNIFRIERINRKDEGMPIPASHAGCATSYAYALFLLETLEKGVLHGPKNLEAH